MAQADGPMQRPSHYHSEPSAEVGIILSNNPMDPNEYESMLNITNVSLLQEFCCEEVEDHDDDILSNSSDGGDGPKPTSSKDNFPISVTEIEMGIDSQTQTEGFQNIIDSDILKENLDLKSQITENKNEIDLLKEKLASMENLVSKLSTKLEDEVGRHDKITKNIKQEINDSKITAAIQNEKSEILDRKTIEKTPTNVL